MGLEEWRQIVCSYTAAVLCVRVGIERVRENEGEGLCVCLDTGLFTFLHDRNQLTLEPALFLLPSLHYHCTHTVHYRSAYTVFTY